MRQSLQKWSIIAALAAFVGLFFVDYVLLPPLGELEGRQQKLEAQAVPKISDIQEPRIDDQAASICQTESASVCTAAPSVLICQTLPVALWVFLLAMYVGLLIFNLSFAFAKQEKAQWVGESLLTLAFLGQWFWFDECRAQLWFPLYILKLGIIIYAVYLYFLENKKGETGGE